MVATHSARAAMGTKKLMTHHLSDPHTRLGSIIAIAFFPWSLIWQAGAHPDHCHRKPECYWDWLRRQN